MATIGHGLSPDDTIKVITKTSNPTVNDDTNAGYELGDLWINTSTDTSYTCTDNAVGAAVWETAGSGVGDVTGPASSTDNAIARFDGVGGKTLQNSSVTIDDTNNIDGVTSLSTADLDFTGTSTAGLKVKVLTTAQRTAITPNGAEIVYDSDTDTIWYGDDGASWNEITAGSVTASSTTTFTNKSLSDSTTFIIDEADNTKKFQFQVSGITTGTTRTWTVPDSDDTFVGKATTDTLTNKTFDANGTGNTISNIETADLAASAKTGADTKVVTGTAGTSGNISQWNVDGDLVDASIAAADVVTPSSTNTFTNKTWNSAVISETYGGTGESTYTLGDTLYSDSANSLAKLAGNTTATKNFLSQTGNGTISAAPSWSTVSKSDVGLANVENTALSTWAGSTNLTTLGTITTGTWTGTDIAVADGGTGRSTATAYAVLCGGTTSTAAHQSIASVGTSGQVLTSNGAGALPTFQNATGGLVLLATATASNSTTLDFTTGIDSTYETYLFIGENLLPTTDAVTLNVRTSTDAGSSWDSGASDYRYAQAVLTESSATLTIVASTGAAQIVLLGNVGTAGGEAASFELFLHNPSSASQYPLFDIISSNVNNSTALVWRNGSAMRASTADVDGVRFLMSSGNISSGTIRLYGVVKS